MYFSRVQLNPQRRHAKMFLANPRALHAAVEAGFPPGTQSPGEGRTLWRLDTVGHHARLYIVSPTIPDFSHLVEQAGWATVPGETIDYSRFLDGIREGQEFSFKVTVNPVKRQFVHGGRGKVLPHVTEEQQVAWFRDRSTGWGFTPSALPALSGASVSVRSDDALRVVERRNRTFGKPDDARRRTVTQRQVSIEGQLQVRDAAVFREALVNGMGRGKAYGCGLMTVARGGDR